MHTPLPSVTLAELAEQHDLEFEGDGTVVVDGVGTLAEAGPTQISFLSNPAYREQLAATRAAAVIISANDADSCPVSKLVADDPYVAYAKIAGRFDPRRPSEPGIHASASVDDSAQDRKSTRLNSSHSQQSRMPSSA